MIYHELLGTYKPLENKQFIALIQKDLRKFTEVYITNDKLHCVLIIKPMLALTRYNKANVMKFS